MGTRLKFALGLAAATVLAGAGTALAGSMTGGSNYSLWSGKDAPNTPADPDGQPVELGLKFTADRAGTVTGVRFYKSSANTGTHTGSLWSDSGQRLATVTFTGESASGWQSATFAQPVPVAPGRTYVVSYHTDTGHYADDEGYFAAPRTRGPLRAPADRTGAPNGVFAYGSSAFPTQGWHASNYWVDIVFRPGAGTVPSGPSGSAQPPTQPVGTPSTAPSQTAGPRPSSTAPSASGGCPGFPAFPDAGCTGWQHTGVTLRPQSGDMTITQPGTVVDGIDLRGSIKIKASNVTVRRSRIRGAYGVGTGDHTPYSNILIEDVELDGYDPAVHLDDGEVHSSDQLGLSGIDGDGITVRRANIHGFGTLVRSGNNFTVEDSWLHDNRGGTDLTGKPTHNTAMSAHYGHHLVIRHNRLSCNAGNHCSSGVSIYAKDSGTEGMGDILIQNNIFRTDDGPCLFAGHDLNAGTSAGLARDERVLDNAFTPGDCGAGYVYHWGTTDLNGASLGNTWSGNYLYPDRTKLIPGAY